MKPYPKTENLFARKEGDGRSLDYDRLRCPEFGNIKRWYVTEKVDGTNIRMDFRDGRFAIGGRTDNAQLPPSILSWAMHHEMGAKLKSYVEARNLSSVTIYGEGYGPKIQARGGLYRDDVSFVLFDVLMNDRVWVLPEHVPFVAADFGIDVVPHLGLFTSEEAVDLCANFASSKLAKKEGCEPEGIIGVEPHGLTRCHGDRIKWKLRKTDLARLDK